VARERARHGAHRLQLVPRQRHARRADVAQVDDVDGDLLLCAGAPLERACTCHHSAQFTLAQQAALTLTG
jgi:hypothetical protein